MLIINIIIMFEKIEMSVVNSLIIIIYQLSFISFKLYLMPKDCQLLVKFHSITKNLNSFYHSLFALMKI